MASTQTTANSTWVSPRTWVAGELITATIMNAHVRDQLTALKSPAYGFTYVDEAADYTTTSTSFVDVDATDLAITITTGGGTLSIDCTTLCKHSTTGLVYLDASIDGTRVGLDDGLAMMYGTTPMNITFHCEKAGLSAGSHTIKLQWKCSAGTATMYAGAGTASYDIHPFFTVKEVT